MRNILTNIRTSQVAEATEMLLSYNATTSLNILIETASGDDWEIDWGDGVWERYASNNITYRTKTFGSATAGVVKVRSATGRGLSDLHLVHSDVGTWSFDVADLCATYNARFVGDSMALTGDVGDIKATYAVWFEGNLMTLTGSVGDIKATYEAYFIGDLMTLTGNVGDIKAEEYAIFIGDSITLTGNVGDIKATYEAYFQGSSMELTYTTKTWTHIPINYFSLSLATGHLTTAELSQMLIDMDASGITGDAILALEYNNGAPNAAGAIAADNLRAKGYTVLTNTETMYLSYNPTTSLNLMIQTASEDDWEIDWGDGVWEQYTSAGTTRTKTFGSSTSGVAKVRSATGRELSDLHWVESFDGTWSFDVADLCATYIARFEGESMTITGDVADIKATSTACFVGDSMTLTGGVGTIKATWEAMFIGNSMTLTGSPGDIKATFDAHFQGDSMELTYTTQTWTKIPAYSFLLDLASGHLSTAELSQMLVDMDDSGITGGAFLDFQYNNGAPNAAGEIAADNLRAKGYTVLTNVAAPTYEAETIDFMTAVGIPNDSATYYSTLKNSDVWDIIDDYVKAEKANGSFQFFDYPMIGSTATQHSYNLVNTSKFQITWSGSWTHSELGAKGNGSNTYGRTGFVPSDEQDVYSNGLSYVSGTDLNEIKSTVMVIGQAVDSNSTGLMIQVNKPSIRTMMNGNSIIGSVSTNSGVVTAVRQSNTVTKIFKDGSQLASGNSGGVLPSYEVFLGTYGRRGTAVVNSCSIQRFQSFKAHIGLTDAQVSQHHANIDAREAALLRKTW